jgi:AcrB/AcrD/AcrF family
MERFIVWSLVTMNWLGLASRPANAQAPAGSQRQAIVTLNSLVAELLAKNPELQAVRKRYETALTRPYQDSALLDPCVTAGWSSNGNPVPGAGLGVKFTSIHGAVERLRPKMMTVSAAFMRLMPSMWSIGIGSDMMKRVVAPMVGGLGTSFVLELLVYASIHFLWKWHAEVKNQTFRQPVEIKAH